MVTYVNALLERVMLYWCEGFHNVQINRMNIVCAYVLNIHLSFVRQRPVVNHAVFITLSIPLKIIRYMIF